MHIPHLARPFHLPRALDCTCSTRHCGDHRYKLWQDTLIVAQTLPCCCELTLWVDTVKTVSLVTRPCELDLIEAAALS